jgi:hypothetical protein
VPLWLRFDHANGLSVSVQHVVGISAGEWKFSDGDACTGRDVHLPPVLDQPTSLIKLDVDLLACFLFRRHALALLEISDKRCGIFGAWPLKTWRESRHQYHPV